MRRYYLGMGLDYLLCIIIFKTLGAFCSHSFNRKIYQICILRGLDLQEMARHFKKVFIIKIVHTHVYTLGHPVEVDHDKCLDYNPVEMII